MAFGRSSSKPIGVLIVDADPSQRRSLSGLIAERTQGRFAPHAYATTAEALAAARDNSASIAIADLETIGGPSRLAEMPAMALIATSADVSLNNAVAAVKGGAIDFLPKPIGAKALIERLEAALGSTPPHQPEPAGARGGTDFAGFIGRSPGMLELYDQIRRIARSRAPVFITGESGTGKELCAEAIHQSGGGAGRPFVAINCSAIPKELMESEIFGHVRGAFTGAADDRAGAAELADGGTLFLDEIAEMDLSLQAKLLRFVQSGTIRRVGGSQLKRVDVRIVCATNREPFTEVGCGRFRADLFYRLHVLPIHVPPLRARPEDIYPLAEAFLRRFAAEETRSFAGFDGTATALLEAYSWPGNVRQLENVVRRIVVLNEGQTVTAEMLPDAVKTRADGDQDPTPLRSSVAIAPLWQQERQIIEAVLASFDGSIARAAAALDISPSTIYRKQKSWSERRFG
jgi:two-component system repressor protein LuxO